MENKKSAVLITGASSGIGKSLVEVFVENDFFVIGIARREEKLLTLKKSLSKKENLFVYYINDLSDINETSKLLDEINSKYFINCLVNNAGISSFKNVLDDTFEDIEKIIRTNLLTPIFLIKKILPEMVYQKKGTIINILSVVNKKIFKNSSIYAASKNGLESYANVLREEHRNDNISVINVYPGATSTEIWPSNIVEKYSEKMMSPENVAKIIFQSFNQIENVTVEEIVVRPISGDL